MAKSVQGKTLVVVESPTKAKTIRKFLPKDYVVESCMGHVRDLPQSAKDIPEKYRKEAWSRLGVNVDNKFDPIYCVPKNKTKIVSHLKSLVKDVDEVILATDEDREGESISWHLLEVLKPKVPTKRMVFHEITKEAILKSLKEVRDIDYNMVRAQEARRILDRLVGYTISPLLWKKVAYGLSAGRVQSVAVRLIAEREHERIRFVKSQYGSLSGDAEKSKEKFPVRLNTYKSKKLAIGKDFDELTGELAQDRKDKVVVLNQKMADEIKSLLKNQKLKVIEVEEKPVSRKPSPPFITSTLQQESNRKLGLSSRETMQIAQKLYEQGLITYMRTDSTFLSQQAIEAARKEIKSLYGAKYLPDSFRDYTSKKSKGAQEAHEAIRPAGTDFVKPEDAGLVGAQFKVYDLIWKRTIASQMVNAEQKQVSVKMEAPSTEWNASGMTITFPGFLKAYVEGFDDPEAELADRETYLPELKVGELVDVHDYKFNQHETKPPARYTEASLVQKLEKEGVGRPSTYASIIGTIQDRGYVKKANNQLQPTFTALIVTQLLKKFFPDYVDLNFTSSMEDSLDEIASGDKDWADYLSGIYLGKAGLKNQVESKEDKIDPEESRSIALKGLEKYSFRIGRYGAYVCRKDKDGKEICASLPEESAPADVSSETADKLIDLKINGADALGKDPKSGLPVYVLNGRYGPYVQLGDSTDDEEKPKRVSIPTTLNHEALDFQTALKLLSLPLNLGLNPDTKKEIKAGIGRFGPYIVHDGDFRSIPKEFDIFSLTLKEALEILSKPKKGRGKSSALKSLGEHPQTKEVIEVFNGKYGPYVKCGKVNVSLPEGVTVETVDLAQAVTLLSSRMEDGEESSKASSKSNKKTGASKSVKKVKVQKTLSAETKAVKSKTSKKLSLKDADIKSKTKVGSQIKVRRKAK
jgi:DNA topoisomerase I